MKKYTLKEVADMIEEMCLMIPIDKFFINNRPITKKEYGKILIEQLCSELRIME